MNLFQLPRKNFKMHEQGSKAHPLEWVPLTTAFEITYDVSNINIKNEQKYYLHLKTFLIYWYYEIFDIYSLGLHIWAWWWKDDDCSDKGLLCLKLIYFTPRIYRYKENKFIFTIDFPCRLRTCNLKWNRKWAI